MLNYVFTVIILILNFILQTTVFKHFSIIGVVPNTALIIVVIFALLRGKYKGAFTGLIAGLLQDILFAKIIGINALIYFLLGYVVGVLGDKVFKESLMLAFLTMLGSTLIYHIAYYLFMIFLSRDISFITMIKDIAIKEMIYNSILTILIYKKVLKHYRVPKIRFSKSN